MLLSRDHAIEYLLHRHPSFFKKWTKHLDFWGEEKSGITNEFGVFAEFILDAFDTQNIKVLSSVPESLEHLIIYGDESVVYGVTLGCLESLTNVLLTRSEEHTSELQSPM